MGVGWRTLNQSLNQCTVIGSIEANCPLARLAIKREKEQKVKQEGLGLDIQENQHSGNYNQQGLGVASSQGGFET